MPVPESYHVDMGHCLCGAALTPRGFRDRESYQDAFVTSLCQQCQDRTYLAVDQEEGHVFPIFDGAVVAVRAPGAVAELALLPFHFVVPAPNAARVAWEARFITRAGPWLDPVDVAYELDPMAGLLLDHQVRLSEYTSFDASAVSDRIRRVHLLIALDGHSLDAIAGICPLSDRISVASLAEEVPWAQVFGRPLRPLDTWTGPEPRPLSTLRMIAVMALLLMEQGRDRLRPLDYLIRQRCRFFPQKFHEQA